MSFNIALSDFMCMDIEKILDAVRDESAYLDTVLDIIKDTIDVLRGNDCDLFLVLETNCFRIVIEDLGSMSFKALDKSLQSIKGKVANSSIIVIDYTNTHNYNITDGVY